MRGSAAFRAAVAPGGVLAGPWVRNELWRRARAVPSLDLQFADNKSLVDATTGANLVTFTRASSGTYVDSQGVIKTAVTNLLLRSEEFDNASWTKQSSVSVSANTTVAPNGTTTADTITADSGLGIYQTITSVVGLNYTNSIYVKAGTATSLLLRDDTGAGRHIQFNPSTGQITATAGTLISSGSQAVGDGWFRVWMVYAADANTVRGIIRPASSGSAQTYILWGAQLEQSSTVGEYIPTTSTINSAPRFDHDPTTGESLGLLVEEARTNLCLHNRTLTNAAWVATNITAAKDQTGVDGVSNSASKITASAGNGTILQTITSASAARATSAYVKRITGTGIIEMTQDNGTTWTAVTVTSVWTRVTIPSATVTNPVVGFRIVTNADAIAVDFVQLESGAFSTSAIETTTATATRSADVASITGTAFSSWYRQDEGTVFVAGIPYASSQGTFASIDDTTANQRWQIRYTSDRKSRLRFVSTGNNLDTTTPAGAFTANASIKIASSAAVGGQVLYINAGSLLNGAATAMPVVTQMSLGTGPGTDIGSQTISRFTYWPQRLPNSTLQAITQ